MDTKVSSVTTYFSYFCLQETWAYMEMYMDNILHEAFVNMFQENPELKEKFVSSIEKNGRRRKYICNLILWNSTIGKE